MNIWIDLENPSEIDSKRNSNIIGSPIPTRANLESTERSLRFDVKNDNIYLTIPVLLSDGEKFSITPLGIILSPTKCLTLRYTGIGSFRCVERTLDKIQNPTRNDVLLTILECLMDKLLDDMDVLDQKLISTSQDVFNYDIDPTKTLPRETLKSLGNLDDHISAIKKAAVGLLRAIDYLTGAPVNDLCTEDISKLENICSNLDMIADITKDMANKTSFLLDSTLGFINIDQNNYTRLLTISSSILVFPTLIAGFYGMNFDFIPGLHTHNGYLYCTIFMAIIIAIPGIIFWRKDWFKFQ